MSTTAVHTRRLVEHRYGRPLEHLRDEVAHHRCADPVLPIVLRRLTELEQIGEQGCALRATVHKAVARDSRGGDRLSPYIAELMCLEQQEQSQAETLWDLLDLRLLLDQQVPGWLPPRRPGRVPDDQDLMDAARQAAAHMPRLTRDALRLALRDRGIPISNHRLGLVLRRLRAEHTR